MQAVKDLGTALNPTVGSTGTEKYGPLAAFLLMLVTTILAALQTFDVYAATENVPEPWGAVLRFLYAPLVFSLGWFVKSHAST